MLAVLLAVAAAVTAYLVVGVAPLSPNLLETVSSDAPAEPSSTRVDSGLEPEPPSSKEKSGVEGRQLPDGIWIRGRVSVPEGTPTDERLEVEARVLSLEDDPGFAAPVDADGRFLAMFPKDAERGWLELKSRYLYLECDYEIDLSEPLAGIVLEPRLGGCVRGQLVLPARVASARMRAPNPRIELMAIKRPGSAALVLRTATADENLCFEFRSVPARPDYVLTVSDLAFVPVERTFAVPPGATADLEIDLHPGVSVSGWVFDPSGAPVRLARVCRAEELGSPFMDRREPDARTPVDGSFSIRAIRPGPVRIVVDMGGFLPERIDLGDLADGEVRSDLQVHLRSARISGRVEWPGGMPAIGCKVSLVSMIPIELLRSRPDRGYREIQTSSGGQFSFTVTSEGPYHLTAHAASAGPSSDRSDHGEYAGGIAMVDSLRPGDPPLVMVLEHGHDVSGRVVDDLGEPVDLFSVEASPSSASGAAEFLDRVSAHFHSADGTFTISGLASGTWVFEARTPAFGGPPSDPVVVPGRRSPVTLVVPRGATLSGTVVDPSGDPVSFADVQVDPGSSVKTRWEGRFDLKRVQPGEVELWASSESWARSESLRLVLEPGQMVGDLTLRLRRGGRIAGEVLDREGQPEADREISICSDRGDCFPSARSDADGRFESSILLPGPYVLMRQLKPGEVHSLDSDESSPEATASVVEDGITHVVIGGR